MAIKTNIIGGGGTGRIADLQYKNGRTGLTVYNDKLLDETSRFLPYFNDTYGIEMNQNGAFSGTPDRIHNGLDNTYWTASSINGNKFTFNSTEQANNGTRSIKINNASVGHIMQFAKGSDVTMSNYSSMSLAIYVDNNWAVGDSIEIYAYDTGTGSEVGDRVKLENFFNFNQFDEWQSLVIPLDSSGFNITNETTVDAFRVEIVSRSGQGPTWYMDDIQIEESGGSIVYCVTPNVGTIFRIYALRLMLIDNVALTNIDWESFLGVGKLTNGVNYQRTENDEIKFNFTTRCVRDFLWVGLDVNNQLSDGTDSILTFESEFFEPGIMDSRRSDKATITISDDLSGMLGFRAALIGKEERIDHD